MSNNWSTIGDELIGTQASPQCENAGWSPSFKQTPASRVWKRAFDIVGATLLLIFLLPLLGAIAFAIYIDSGAPILFRQRRTGLNGRVFTILKFRSMSVAEDGERLAHATQNDPRVTRLGALLRVSSSDELPQLVNVLMGDMSLVGPRPHALAHDDEYGALLPQYNERFAVRPGLTGLAQVQGLRGEIKELGMMARRIDADVRYANNWSFRDDLLILLRTIPVLLSRENAY